MYPLFLSLLSPIDADIVCLQEVSPVSFEDDFAFMAELGYDGKEM
jgi:mRNA deadenylase 3'-5' endonuclease subunit Ccr4